MKHMKPNKKDVETMLKLQQKIDAIVNDCAFQSSYNLQKTEHGLTITLGYIVGIPRKGSK